MNSAILRGGLDALYYSGACRALAPITRGAGIIFMMHHIAPHDGKRFAPNGLLSITPEFLAAAVGRVRTRGWDIVSIGEAVERLAAPDSANDNARPFAAFTIDDGYRDNLAVAYPVMKALNAPLTVYVSTALPDGTAELWWCALEAVIAQNGSIEVDMGAGPETIDCSTLGAKTAAWKRLYPWIRNAPEDEQRDITRRLCARYGVSLEQLCGDLSMNWDEVRRLGADPLVTIGAHTVNHFALIKLDEARARREMEEGAAKLASELGARPQHFAYPYGDPGSAGPREFKLAAELGFTSAVTTRKGMLTKKHAGHLFALPRVALNGDFQSLRYVDAFLSGAPFFLFNRFRLTKTA